MGAEGLRRRLKWFIPAIMLLCALPAFSQDDILDEIEAELKREQELKKAQEKAEKNKEKNQAIFQASVRKGDALMKAKKFEDAIEAYEEAIEAWPADKAYPEQQIAKAREEKKLAEEAAKKAEIEAEYKSIISKADAYFNGKKWDDAISAYQEAAKVDPSMAYPKDQIAEAKQLKAKEEEERKKAEEQARIDKAYEEAMAAGDAALKSKDFDEAIAKYDEAAKIKPNDAQAKSRKATAEKQKADEAARLEQEKIQKQYDDLIAEADGLLKSSKFDEAKTKYEAASKVMPHETYPKTKMKECDDSKLAAQQAAMRAEYDELIKEADALLKAENFEGAIAKYEEAGKVLPHETHPKDMITQAQNLKQQKAQNEKVAAYEAVMKAAENLIAEEKFDEGIAKLEEAHKMLPGEDKTHELIAEAQKLKTEKAQRIVQEQYDEKIKEGEDFMHAKKYDQAIASLEAAKKIKPGDHKADNLITQINDLKKADEAAALQESFDAKIKEGENFLSEQRFDEAIAAFTAAQQIKPNDPKPKNLISQANELRNNLEKQKAKEEYDELLAEGDKEFEAGNFDAARKSYKSALAAYADGQSTVDARLAKVDQSEKEKLAAEKAEAEAAAKKAQFDKIMAEVDGHISSGELDMAKQKNANALLLFPNDANALKKKSEIEGLQAKAEKERQEQLAKEAAEREQAEKEKQVSEFIAKANEAQSKNELTQAKNYVASALAIIPDDPTALTKQKEIDDAIKAYEKKLAEDEAARKAEEKAAAERKATIDKLMAEGSNLLTTGKYEESIKKYDEVLSIDTSNEQAKAKKQEAQQSLDRKKQQELAAAEAAQKAEAEAAKQKQIDELMQEGDKLFASKDYSGAISKFEQILSLESGNALATQKINEVKGAMNQAEQEKLAAQKAEEERLAAEAAAKAEEEKKQKIATLNQEAQQLETAEKYDEAVAKWKEVLTLESANAVALDGINRAEFKKAEAEKAALAAAAEAKQQQEEEARKKAELEKRQAEEAKQAQIAELKSRAKVEEENKNYTAALASWGEVLKLNSADSEASLAQKRINQKIADQEAAELAAQEAERKKLEEEARKKAELEKQQAEANRLQKIADLKDQARSQEISRDYASALASWKEVKSINSSDSEADENISRLEKKISEEKAAILAAEEAERKKQEEAAALKAEQEKRALINTYIESGDKLLADQQYGKAIESYNKAKDLDPDNPTIPGKLSKAEELKTAEEKRIADLQAAERQKEISMLLTEAKLLSIKREFRQAETKYKKVLEYEPQNENAQEGLENIREDLELVAQKEAEEEARRKAEQELKNKVEQILDEGANLYAGGEYDKAIEKYKEGLELDPLNAELKASIRNAKNSKERAEMYRLAKMHGKPRPRPEGFKAESIGNTTERKDKIKFENELGKAYPEGVTEEKINQKRKEILRRIVVKEGKGNEYFKVRHDWGGVYYFKNGESITPYLFQYDTRSPDQITN